MKKTKLMNAVAYARTAIKNNKSNNRIKRQLSEIEKYANKNGYKISKVYADNGFGGNAPDRPALHQLHKDAELGKWKVVLIHDLSRLARSSVIYKQIENNLQKNGVKIVSTFGADNSPMIDLINNMCSPFCMDREPARIKAKIAIKKQQ
ncbi:MAG: recombinase family protein [Candidatus Staskawiczbacteria bacterium]|nr:recombinase family protein [Candidatus Staskawiczbacteria bacterium]